MSEKFSSLEYHSKSKKMLTALALSALTFTACSSPSIPPPPQFEVADGDSDADQNNCANYGKSLEAAKKYLGEHEADQDKLIYGWQRAIIVKTTVTPARRMFQWTGTLLMPDGSLRLLRAAGYSDGDLASLTYPGDYIAFDNVDRDFNISRKEITFLGHGVISCEDNASALPTPS